MPENLVALVPGCPLCAHFFQNWPNRGIRSQQGGVHDVAEFLSRLFESFMRRPHCGVGHRFLMGRSQLRSFSFIQAGPAGAAFHSKLSRRFVRGRLRQDGRRELERGGQGRNEEEGQFRFHILII